MKTFASAVFIMAAFQQETDARLISSNDADLMDLQTLGIRTTMWCSKEAAVAMYAFKDNGQKCLYNCFDPQYVEKVK